MTRPPYDAEMLAWISVHDRFRCHLCGKPYRRRDPWEIDHVVPYAVEGRHRLRNMRLAHRSCNRRKGAAA